MRSLFCLFVLTGFTELFFRSLPSILGVLPVPEYVLMAHRVTWIQTDNRYTRGVWLHCHLSTAKATKEFFVFHGYHPIEFSPLVNWKLYDIEAGANSTSDMLVALAARNFLKA